MHKRMIERYICDYCNKEFDNEKFCKLHEKYEHKCHECKHAYYVYGCELNCELKRCRFSKK